METVEEKVEVLSMEAASWSFFEADEALCFVLDMVVVVGSWPVIMVRRGGPWRVEGWGVVCWPGEG